MPDANLYYRKEEVCGGAVLLDGGVPVDEWTKDSLKIAGDEIAALKAVRDILEDITGGERFHEYAPFMAYAGTEEPQKIRKYLLEKNIPGVNIFCDSRKVYCTAASLTKGNALDRLRAMFAPEEITAAGDGEQDISMFAAADTAIFPRRFEGKAGAKKMNIISDSEFLSDDIQGFLKKYVEKSDNV